MATITASPSISTISYSGTSAKSGTMSWTKPTVPSGATISSCKLTGTCVVSASSRQVTVTVNGTTVANKADSGNYNFEIDLGTSNNTTSVTVTATGSQKQASGTVSFSNLVYTVTYTSDIPVTGITLSPTNITVQQNKSVIVNAILTPDGSADEIIWSINDTNIATLTTQASSTQIGINGKTVGEATITATTVKSGISVSEKVTVEPLMVEAKFEVYLFTGSYGNAAQGEKITNYSSIIDVDYSGTGEFNSLKPLNINIINKIYSLYEIQNYNNLNYSFSQLYSHKDIHNNKYIAEYSFNDEVTLKENCTLRIYLFQGTFETETSYTVIFKDWDGTVLKTEQVVEGESATAPSNPTRDGYTFTGWDITFNNVTSDLTVTAQYEEALSFKVTIVKGIGQVLIRDRKNMTDTYCNFTKNSNPTISEETNVVLPNGADLLFNFNGLNGYKLKRHYYSGSNDRGSDSNVMQSYMSSDQLISSGYNAVYVEFIEEGIVTYTVTFEDWNGTVLKKRVVEEGESATAPNNPTRDGYTFTGWNKMFDNITSNLTVTAQYTLENGEPEEDIIEWTGIGTVATNIYAEDYWKYKLNMDWDTQYLEISFNGKNRLGSANLFYWVDIMYLWNDTATSTNDSRIIEIDDEGYPYILGRAVDEDFISSIPECTVRFSKINQLEVFKDGALVGTFTDNLIINQSIIYLSSHDFEGNSRLGGAYAGGTITSIEVKSVEPDNNELVQGDINEDGTFNDESTTAVRTKYIDISGKKSIQVNVLTDNVYISACYLYNANKELVKVIEIPADKKRKFGVNLQELIAQIIEDEGSDQ